MRIRFGYVAMALDIQEGSPNKTVTVTNLLKIAKPEDRIHRLRRLARENLTTQLRVLKYNAAYDIEVFRFTSRLIPLATHPEAAGWDYAAEFAGELLEIGDFVRKSAMRVSAHPDHFTLLTSPDDRVTAASIADLAYHARLFDAMGLGPEAKLVVHVGGAYNGRGQALERFRQHYAALPAAIQSRLIIENDDKTYSAAEVLQLCREIGAPMVLDVHHHKCKNNGEDLTDLWPSIVATWRGEKPKIHLSSPKDGMLSRAHAEYIDKRDLLGILHITKKLNTDYDIMIEAKQKDLALHKLMAALQDEQGLTMVNQAAIYC